MSRIPVVNSFVFLGILCLFSAPAQKISQAAQKIKRPRAFRPERQPATTAGGLAPPPTPGGEGPCIAPDVSFPGPGPVTILARNSHPGGMFWNAVKQGKTGAATVPWEIPVGLNSGSSERVVGTLRTRRLHCSRPVSLHTQFKHPPGGGGFGGQYSALGRPGKLKTFWWRCRALLPVGRGSGGRPFVAGCGLRLNRPLTFILLPSCEIFGAEADRQRNEREIPATNPKGITGPGSCGLFKKQKPYPGEILALGRKSLDGVLLPEAAKRYPLRASKPCRSFLRVCGLMISLDAVNRTSASKSAGQGDTNTTLLACVVHLIARGGGGNES